MRIQPVDITLITARAVSGVLCLILAYGWWQGRSWAWTLGLVFVVFGIVINLSGVAGNVSERISTLVSELING